MSERQSGPADPEPEPLGLYPVEKSNEQHQHTIELASYATMAAMVDAVALAMEREEKRKTRWSSRETVNLYNGKDWLSLSSYFPDDIEGRIVSVQVRSDGSENGVEPDDIIQYSVVMRQEELKKEAKSDVEENPKVADNPDAEKPSEKWNLDLVKSLPAGDMKLGSASEVEANYILSLIVTAELPAPPTLFNKHDPRTKKSLSS